MSNSATLASSSSPPVIPMVPRLRQLFKACNKGDFSLCNHLIIDDPDILLSTTPYKNNCLHIAAMLGHDEFAKEVWSRAPSLFSGTNIDGETPLIAALMAANLALASDMITAASQYMQHDDLEDGRLLNRMLLMVDRCEENALHHAMRNGLENLALQLLEIEPRLSEQVSNTNESLMYMAARRGYSKVVERLLEIPSSADCGPPDESALDAGVRYNHKGIVKQLLEGRSQLAYHTKRVGFTPLHIAVLHNNLEMVKILLEHDPNLAYVKEKVLGYTPFIFAVKRGYFSIVKEIMGICPDSVFTPDNNGDNALMNVINSGNQDSIDYILRTPQFHRFINQRNKKGNLPLHVAARKCDPKIIRSLLSHAEQDYTTVNVDGSNAVNQAYLQQGLWKTLKWNESFTLLSNIIPSVRRSSIKDEAKEMIMMQSIDEVKSLTAKYTQNTSLVAALLATITFAAAFTLPGGFSSDPANAGLPIFARKAAFQVFLISDTIAMCSSLAVAFLCILATWEDLDFLLNYRKTTRALMWCAYGTTALAFGTGLFTVIAPNNLWLSIFILVLCIILPFISKIIGIVKQLLEGQFQLAYHKDKFGNNPLHIAVRDNKLMLVRIFLEYDPNLAHTKIRTNGFTPFLAAMAYGFVPIAKEIMNTCPDTIYTPDNDGDSALHLAILFEKTDSVDYILSTPQLHRFINQSNNDGNLPLHYAADKCNPKLLRSLLTQAGQDYTAVNVVSNNAVNEVYLQTTQWKTLKWNESFTLLSNVIPSAWNYQIRDKAKKTIQQQAIKEVKNLTQKYTSNTSLVAALLATITFAAAFTLPGGFSSDSSDARQSLFARKATFQVFLISDTIAMCSSLAVAFLCILATWEDLDFLLNYKKTTRALMWCAYGATAIAFGTGLFTVIAPKNLWLAILILVLCTILPLLSKIIGEWPLLMLRYRLRGLFQKDLVPNI